MGLKVRFTREGFPTLGAGPQVDPVVELGQLRLAMDISDGVQRTLVRKLDVWLERGHHRHQGLLLSVNSDQFIVMTVTWWTILLAIEDILWSHRLRCCRLVGGGGAGGRSTNRNTPATQSTRHRVRPAVRQRRRDTDMVR